MPTIEHTLPLISYQYSYAVRKTMLKIVDGLLSACSDHGQMKELLLKVLPSITQLLDQKLDKLNFKELRMIMKHLQVIFKEFWNVPDFLPIGTASAVIDFLTMLCQACKKDKEERIKQLPQAKKKMDLEDLEFLKEDMEKIDKITKHAMELSAVILKSLKTQEIHQKVLEKLAPVYAKSLLNLSASENYEILTSVCFLCDCIEHGIDSIKQPIMAQSIDRFASLMQKYEEDLLIVQSCIFGLGLCSQYMSREQFNQRETLQGTFRAIINKPDARSDENASFTENAIGAVGKLLYFQCEYQTVETQSDFTQYLSAMPLWEDPEESNPVHKLFIQKYLEGNELVMSQQQAAREALRRIGEHHKNKPEDEILDDEGVQLLSQVQ